MVKAAIDKKFQNDKWKAQAVRNNILICRDCQYRLDDAGMPCNTSKCKKYLEMKPVQVLGGGDCSEYKKE